MKMTIYQQELARKIARKYGRISASRLVAELCSIGVVDHCRCKILAVRSWVDETMKRGEVKTAAMLEAAEHFCVSYEYVRNCMYYHTDVNFRIEN